MSSLSRTKEQIRKFGKHVSSFKGIAITSKLRLYMSPRLLDNTLLVF
jgi:hypothetical protein